MLINSTKSTLKRCTICSRRDLHHSAFRIVRPRHPAFGDLGAALIDLPRFRTRGEDVKVLYEPTQFYQTLLKRIAGAKRRIFIASLYIGKEETEIIEALRSALARNPQLKLTIVLDYLRSTREAPQQSSASLVASLSAAFPNQVEFRLYHTSELTGLRKKLIPRRFDEGWGLQHMKCYGFDDNIIISGANLSNDYFTNRQDRYMEFTNHSPLADYFASLLDTVGSYSFLASATDTTSTNPALNITWPTSNPAPSPLARGTSMKEYKSQAHEAFTSLTRHWNSKSVHALCSSLPPPTPSSTPASQVYDTSVRPVLQIGPFSITQETDLVVPTIFRTGNSLATAPGGAETTIDWTSGYFSVQEAYRERVLDSRSAVRIVAAAPEANGFFNSRGVSKYIPPAYTHFQQLFYNQTIERSQKRRKENHVELREWKREGWTYHAKGIWLTPSLSSTVRLPFTGYTSHVHTYDIETEPLSYPTTPLLTLIGSSNYGRRSAERDVEANLLITTFSPSLRKDLLAEIALTRKYATDLVDEKLFKRKDRQVSRGVKIASKVIENML